MARPEGAWLPDGRASALRRDCQASLGALGRPIDTDGFAFYSARLAQRVAVPNTVWDLGADVVREGVALQVLTSGEAYLNLVVGTYQNLLRRSVDPDGANYGVSQLTQGTVDQQFFA